MDVFSLRNRVISHYSDYIQSFINIRDERVRTHVGDELRNGLLWPEPLLQLNPAFEPGDTIDAMVDAAQLHPLCRKIFRIKEEGKPDQPLRLHRHQTEAVEAAASGDNYVLTTGTGSGKSLAYIIPIVNYVLSQGSGKGIRAIVVYPMNALANSQQNELEKFLHRGFSTGQPPVTFRRYTGQEQNEEREEILANPPDILLTNYVMLELLLTRPRDKKLVNAARERLQFLVLDELHTYRGRQGADVAMLVRRVRNICANQRLQCVGTSATMAGGGTFGQQQQQIANVASRLFGTEVKPTRVIGETLRRVTEEYDFTIAEHQSRLQQRVSTLAQPPLSDFLAFRTDPLASWIESTFGLTTESGTERLKRAIPTCIGGTDGAAKRLGELTRLDEVQCRNAIESTLMAGYDVLHPETRFPLFAFRLHQFLSRGDMVYASLESDDQRHITTQGQQFVPGGRSRILLPLTFCRECGQEYYVVYRHVDRTSGETSYSQRDLTDQTGENDEESGFLYANADNPWSEVYADMLERLPEDWLEYGKNGLQIKSSTKNRLPQAVQVSPQGMETASGTPYHYVRSPFAFCLNCGVTYGGRQRSDYGKLASLSSEGRSTATTILSLTTLRSLRQDKSLKPEARKLLSFTDNRQDASLQAGHFNDFVEVGMLRSALYAAVQHAGEAGVSHEVLAQRVYDALRLPVEMYAIDPAVKFQARAETDRALREVLAYRIYQDLRRGWRVTSPNLEQCGLLKIEYASLAELCAAEEEWSGTHPALVGAVPAVRAEIAKTLLDYLRRELAIRVSYLDPVYHESLRQLSSQRLRDPWAIDENEQLVYGRIAYPRSAKPTDSREVLYVPERGGFGLYLRRAGTLPHYQERLTTQDSKDLIEQLFTVLRMAGLVEQVEEPKSKDDVPGYKIPASALIWRFGDGSESLRDVIRVPRASSSGQRTNAYFIAHYRQSVDQLHGLRAREHTAQVPSDKRIEREEAFRKATLPLLFCSPTMELGVDISQLNAVNLRNVPPTPANYAQRSGRAGRSGQPALVITYCTAGSPHDQYFFKRPQQMVAGVVAPPRIDLSNEDLVRTHVYAVWLAETDLRLGTSLKDVLNVEGDPPDLKLLDSVRAAIHSGNAKAGAKARMSDILETLTLELDKAGWYRPDWLDRALDQVEERFEQACDRWRELYKSSLKQFKVQTAVIADATRSQKDKDQARRLRGEAEAQMELLASGDNFFQSDFYSYRYFASEGFLPGYNFPRLPLSAYIPGRRRAKNDQNEYLNRPRFLAISEFGPRSIIYHEGSRYIVNKVILPGDVQSETGIITRQAKLCQHCGHLHPIVEGNSNPDRCEQCNTLLNPPTGSLMRMQNVSTKRRDRINSDEEERIRMGYKIATAVRFERNGQRTTTRTATVTASDGMEMLRLTYGHAATIWRINWGWRRSRPDQPPGFVLDIERGYWARNETAMEGDDTTVDPMSESKQRIVPYVEDHRNCLLIEPLLALSQEQLASLQPALKNAIQVYFQIEDGELAAEPLPSNNERRFILLYEASEGGAGVLRQLLDDTNIVGNVAREALRLCHFDPETGIDLRRPPGAKEDCEAACYDCLMSYTNQLDHRLLDRKLLCDFLRQLTTATVQASPVATPRDEHITNLKAQCDSDLEREWLDFLDARNLQLPDVAQHGMEQERAKPDFFYTSHGVAIFIDGIHHHFENIQAHDRQVTARLEDAGFTVIRFGLTDSWLRTVQNNAWLFGATIS